MTIFALGAISGAILFLVVIVNLVALSLPAQISEKRETK